MKKALLLSLIILFGCINIFSLFADDGEESEYIDEETMEVLAGASEEDDSIYTEDPDAFKIDELCDVDSSGSFNWSMPIEIPAGTNGMQPSIAVIYNSMQDNGIMGTGFSVSGLEKIERDTSFPINWDDNDHFVYNGQRLIKDSYGNYHCERENFLLITYSSGTWIVQSKDGVTKYFNEVVDAIDSNGNSLGAARLWSLSKVKDAFGNYYTISYIKENGAYYPDVIEYTKNDSYPLSKTKSIKFEYEDRYDSVINKNPSAVMIDKRISSIKILTDNSFYQRYSFIYDDRNTNNNIIFSRLVNIQLTGTSIDSPYLTETKCLYELEWGENSDFINYDEILDYRKDEYPIDFLKDDLDGNGLIDTYRIFPSILVGIITHITNSDGSYVEYENDYNNDFNEIIDKNKLSGDFDGDGKTENAHIIFNDSVLSDDLTISILKWENNNSFSITDTTIDLNTPITFTERSFSVRNAGDYNGDGKDDIYLLFPYLY